MMVLISEYFLLFEIELYSYEPKIILKWKLYGDIFSFKSKIAEAASIVELSRKLWRFFQ